MKLEPFQIRVPTAVLDDLHHRLRHTRFTSGLRDNGWDFGTSPLYLRELVTYWLESYDWRAREAALNRLPQFTADIGGRIHFVHQHGEQSKGRALLLLHGWPDSFFRYHKVIPLLTAPGHHDADPGDAFDVVVPSLPGFGFTDQVPPAPHQPTRQSAERLWRLMTEGLGYKRFAIAGGDGGSPLAQIMAIDHPESVVGIHLTDLGWHVGNVDPSTLSKEEQAYLAAGKKNFMTDMGYAAVQSTKPQSLAPGLNDSPAGLAAWIIDRFHSWCDGEGDVERSFTKDELLTNIMIYWVTQTIGSSIATYRGETVSPSLTTADHVKLPVGLALFPKDAGGVPPRSFAERTLNVQRWTEMPHGSHFAALEEPVLFANDVRAFFRGLAAEARWEGGNDGKSAV